MRRGGSASAFSGSRQRAMFMWSHQDRLVRWRRAPGPHTATGESFAAHTADEQEVNEEWGTVQPRPSACRKTDRGDVSRGQTKLRRACLRTLVGGSAQRQRRPPLSGCSSAGRATVARAILRHLWSSATRGLRRVKRTRRVSRNSTLASRDELEGRSIIAMTRSNC